jgi:hypothetical protein
VNCFSFACNTERYINGVPVATCDCALGESPVISPFDPKQRFSRKLVRGTRSSASSTLYPGRSRFSSSYTQLALLPRPTARCGILPGGRTHLSDLQH